MKVTLIDIKAITFFLTGTKELSLDVFKVLTKNKTIKANI